MVDLWLGCSANVQKGGRFIFYMAVFFEGCFRLPCFASDQKGGAGSVLNEPAPFLSGLLAACFLAGCEVRGLVY